MQSDSMYQDLQFNDKNIYSDLDTPAANQKKSTQDRQTSKDVKELKRKLLIWRIISTIVSLCIILVIIAAVVFFTQCKKQENKGLQEMLMNTCVKNEEPCRYCANSWIYYSGNCYFFSSDLMNWTNSRDQCRSMGSNLAIIQKREEETFVEQTAPGISWIGLSKNPSGVWIWEDGTVLKEGESFWRNGEPNNQNGVEECVETAPAIYNRSAWNDNNCLTDNRRICKRTAFMFST